MSPRPIVPLLLSCLLLGGAAHAQTPQLIARWGSPGSGPGQFDGPHGIAVDDAGDVYVSERANHRVQKFTSAGTYLTGWGEYGTDTWVVQYNQPGGVAFSRAYGIVLVANALNNHVLATTPTGAFAYFFSTTYGLASQLRFPCDVAVPPSGAPAYVADYSNNRVVYFVIHEGGADHGQPFCQVSHPTGVAAFDRYPDYFVYVVDRGDNCVQKYTDHGTLLATWGSGPTAGLFLSPYAVAVDAGGNVYVVDSGHHRIVKLDAGGTVLATFGDTGPEPVSGESRIAIGPDGSVYVANEAYDCVQVYGTVTVPANRTSWGRIKGLYR